MPRAPSACSCLGLDATGVVSWVLGPGFVLGPLVRIVSLLIECTPYYFHLFKPRGRRTGVPMGLMCHLEFMIGLGWVGLG